MYKKVLSIFLVLIICNVPELSAQKITNELQGYFKASSDTVMYDYFTFDGNGKVDITGIGNGYYFQKDDSLIIYPDKSIFKFLVKGDQLHGVSNWVRGSVWEKVKDTVTDVNRVDAAASDRIAGMLHRYYDLKSTGSEWSLLFEVPDSNYSHSLKTLCDSGLTKACLDYAGLTILQDMGGVSALYASQNEMEKREPNQEVLRLIYRAIELGDINGYEVLGGYYALIGDIKMARESFELGEEMDCRKCAMALFSLNLEEEVKKQEKKNKPDTSKKSTTRSK